MADAAYSAAVDLKDRLGLELTETQTAFFSSTGPKAVLARGWQTLLEGRLLGHMIAAGDGDRAKIKKNVANEKTQPKWENAADIPEDSPVGKLVANVKKSRPLGERPVIKKKEKEEAGETEDAEEEGVVPPEETQPIADGSAAP